jgi:ATP-binding cassette subfamily C protein
VPVLKGISISANRGEKLAVVGRSGSGKTTLSRLLLKLYKADKGSIRLDNIDVSRIDTDYLRHKIAYVPQEAVLFDNSAAYNISYYLAERATPSQIIAASRAAHLHDEIMELPLCYDTNVGEHGYYLSGGQRQRLSIARAVITSPDIIVLDEMTSNLDAMNARSVYASILGLSGGKSVVNITHNMDEIISADKIAVISNGSIKEFGTPAALMRKRGALYQMFRERKGRVIKKETSGPSGADLMDYLNGFLIKENTVRIAKGSRPSLVDAGPRGSALVPKQPFPFSHPEFVVFYSSERKKETDDKPNALFAIADMRKLDAHSLEALAPAMRLNNFRMRASAVKEANIIGEGIDWLLVCDSGEIRVRTWSIRGVNIEGDHLILIDDFRNIYDIDMKKLDRRSLWLIRNTL